MRLMDVVAPAPEGTGMVEGVTSAQFATFNEFPLSEQSRSWAAFNGRRLLCNILPLFRITEHGCK